jgi:multicomponent Na+:H+ antiporter subunit B
MKADPRSKILQITVDWLQPLLLLFSLFLLLRGHNAPGGGFSGGLVAGAAFILAALARGTSHVRQQLPCSASFLVQLGLLLGFVAAILPLLLGQPAFTGLWIEPKLPVIGTAGSFLIFDTGVYLLVMGFVIGVLLATARDVHRGAPGSNVDMEDSEDADKSAQADRGKGVAGS